MSQWGFYFNQDRCIGCKTCVTACKNWNSERRGDALINPLSAIQPDASFSGGNYIDSATGKTNYALYRKNNMKESWRRVTPHESGACFEKDGGVIGHNYDLHYLSVSCNHCDDPACMHVCPMGVISKDAATGAVLASNEACISCGRCYDACPWGAPQFYDPNYREYAMGDPKRPKMTKCTMCVDRIRENLKPACVAACWNRALYAGPVDELPGGAELAEFASDYVEGLGIHTKPNIRFKKKSEVVKP